jgi:23S rRNA pseudoU1915 N3-methylase RlmH
MVIFNVQLISNESGLHISFAGAPEQQQVKSIVQSETAKLEQAFNKKLQLALNAQQASTRLMLADWLEKTRQERRDDLNFLITGIQTQRLEDQQELESRLSLIAENQLQNSQFINQFIQSAAAQESSHE